MFGHSYPVLTSLKSRGEGGVKIQVLSHVDRRVSSLHTPSICGKGETEQLDLSCSALALGNQPKIKKKYDVGLELHALGFL